MTPNTVSSDTARTRVSPGAAFVAASLLAVLPPTLAAAETGAGADPAAIYAEACASCHGETRLGGVGPVLIPQTLGRLKGARLEKVIAEGRPATQMPAFGEELTAQEIAALAEWLHTPLEEIPRWGVAEIAASREMNETYRPAEAPVFAADPLNITLVVEKGDHHVSVMDGDRFEVIHRFPTPVAVHGGIKYSPEGRFAYIMSRDGWVQKFDVWSLQEVGRVRGGINSRNIALSEDGKWLAVANYLPRSLSIIDAATLEPARVIEVIDRHGNPSRVSAVYQARGRDSFVLALKDAAEIWEIATDPEAGPFFEGLVHSAEEGATEAIGAQKGLFARRRMVVDEPLDDFFFTTDYRFLIGAARDGMRGVVINLNTGAKVADLPLPGMPHLGSGISFDSGGRRLMATPHLKEGKLTVIDTETWQVVGTIETLGPGFFLRSHANSPHIWADVFFGPNRDAMHVIDKESLKIVATLRPEPGKTVAHVEFDRQGRHAMVSVWEDDGALLVYDDLTLELVRRLPMRKPSGKYNVGNKIAFEEGTSH